MPAHRHLINPRSWGVVSLLSATRRAGLIVERCDFDHCNSIHETNSQLPWIAADLAILDVLLETSATRIDADGRRLAAVRAAHFCRGVGRSVSKREFFVEVVHC